jgi:hypothetical protein
MHIFYCGFLPPVLFLIKEMFKGTVGSLVSSGWTKRKHSVLSINRKVELFMKSEKNDTMK